MNRIVRASIALLLLGGLSAETSAQIITGGSTAEGDYLRGVGFAASGLANLEVAQSQARRNDTESFIELHSYLSAVSAAERAELARARTRRLKNQIALVAKHRDRILNDPQEADINNGNALNAKRRWLTAGRIHASDLRYNSVDLPTDVVRRLPFKLSEEGATISFPRLLHEGGVAWPVAFQGDKFKNARDEYQRSISAAIDQQIEGKVTPEVIDRVEHAIETLQFLLNANFKSHDKNNYFPAFNHLSDLRKIVEQLKSYKIEAIVADLDRYHGTTIADLVEFMNKHGVLFAAAEWPEEKQAFREVYEALAIQRSMFDEATQSSDP